MRILLVEDDTRLSANLSKLLRQDSFAVDAVETIADGYMKAIDEEYDLTIIDRNLPDGDGLTLVKKLRNEHTKSLLLVLTALSDSAHQIDGLNTGADDYLGKPFAIEVLLARIHALVRRAYRTPVTPILQIGDLQIDLNSHTVKRKNIIVPLTVREYAILEFLARQKDTAVNRSDLLAHAWDENADPFSNLVDVHIKNLRRKLDPGNPLLFIRTVKGVGYMICEPDLS
jgi:DNA-binding response OmpR family regulator